MTGTVACGALRQAQRSKQRRAAGVATGFKPSTGMIRASVVPGTEGLGAPKPKAGAAAAGWGPAAALLAAGAPKPKPPA